jgi:PilZ domain
MISNPENRDKTRFNHNSPVTLENDQLGVLRGARMFNYSDCGLYVEADFRLEPETEVRVGIINSPFASQPDRHESYRGIIKWRRPLKRSAFYYGYGVELLEESVPAKNQDPSYGSRVHPRIECAIPLKYEFDGRTYEGITENVSSGGVFIKTRNLVAVGNPVTVYIPVKKKGKIKRLQGKVTWSNRMGFGVKFERSV